MANKPPIVLNSCGGGGFIVNLQYIPSPTNGRIDNSGGSDAIIPIVDETNAGLMSPAILSIINYIGSEEEIEETIEVEDSVITIIGDGISGTITISVGDIGLSGDLFALLIASTFVTKSVVMISDVYDNYAMGHSGIFRARITDSNEFTLSVKTGFTLETNEIYKLYYYIRI